ncbi:MBL fold metallo-hydrolase [Govanella unica]|uniref:MBL fold metallo-hydrolase n=1 Tax=Govanella unica TaxID=2975056 RepID=A0A9X3Z679_9PROT|nr:MBL fold metallo-hydrolase [Govania unica]MDA5192723.1 MBL fold metallo-hydrolase [Govania unica]
MRTAFVGHAAVLIEANGLRILSDPWWEGPCFGTQWWVYPRPDLSQVEGQVIDYIYISHGHHDHLHLGTLRRLTAGAKILANAGSDVVPFLRDCGFTVIEIADDEECDLGNGVRCRLVATCSDDTLLAVSDGERVCVNLNDALHAAPRLVQDRIIADLKAWYPTIDYLYCGYGIASHFPNCYVVPGMDRAATAARRQAYFNRQWVRIVAELAPRYAFPFAADVAILEEDLIWANEPVHNSERPTDVFRAYHPDVPTKVYDIAPGFRMEGDVLVHKALFEPVDLADLKVTYAAEYAVANRISKIPADGIDGLVSLVADNVEMCRDYLAEFSGNYRVLLSLKDAGEAIRIEKKGRTIHVDKVPVDDLGAGGYDLLFTTRFAYLRRALTNIYGGEVLYVGSGCVIEYRNAAMVKRNLHRDLLALLRHRTKAPPSRFGDQSKLMFLIKQTVKRLLGKVEPDLYDLDSWVVRERT